MASILAVATKLKEIEAQLTGRVRIIFQPAEELVMERNILLIQAR